MYLQLYKQINIGVILCVISKSVAKLVDQAMHCLKKMNKCFYSHQLRSIYVSVVDL